MPKIIKGFLLGCLVCFFLFHRNPGFAAAGDPLNLRAESAILVEGKTGKILYQKNADRVSPVASMAKMMTEYLVLDAIKEGAITWETTTGVSDYAWRISQNLSLSNVPLRRDAKYTVKELYEAMVIYSANGATIALAELIAGSETDFVQMMNDKAGELGLEHYKFVNSTGLNNSSLLGLHPEGTGPEEETVMSTRDVAALAYHFLHEHPEVLNTSRIPRKIFREDTDAVKMDNWNWMLPELIYGYEGIDGLKTGYTNRAGYCFTGTAKRQDTRLISVVMKSDSYQTRFTDTRRLMDYGFNEFKKIELVTPNLDEEGQLLLPVKNGKKTTVTAAPEQPITVLLRPREKELFTVVFQPAHPGLTKAGVLTAPLSEGELVGYLIPAAKGERDYQYLTTEGREKERVAVFTTEAVAKANWFTLLLRSIRDFFVTIWEKITAL